ncbi:protein kinase [Streptosporangium violaceochromogenes]|nr:protein kinase [Streptosporangium violaceochromogenes]
MSDSEEIIGARYRLLEHIGRGGMGTVWRARDEILGRDVAVKEVTPPDLSSPDHEAFTVRTLREARAAGRIGHPGVATVYDVFEERGRPWIVMQLVESRTLGAVIREDGPLPPARVARIGLEVLGALVAAHRVGVLHRDVKPDNVLLARDGRAVLTDFGIAVVDGDSSVTRTGALIGTPAFIAPERASGGHAELASDLWSLGVTLYTAVEGHPPFERPHPLATLSAVMHEEPAPLRRAGPLGPVIYGLLRKDPSRRMSAQEAQLHLRAIASGVPPQATAPIELPAPAPAAGRTSGSPAATAARPARGTPAPARGRRPAVAAVIAAVLAVTTTAGGAAWVAMTSAPPSAEVPAARVPSGDTPETGRAEPSARKDTAAPGAGRGRARNVTPAGPSVSENDPGRSAEGPGRSDDGRDGSGGNDRTPADDRPDTSAGERRARDSGGTSKGDRTDEDPGKGRGREGGDGHNDGKIPGSGGETDGGAEKGSGDAGGEDASGAEPSGPADPGDGPPGPLAGAPNGPEHP